jgi:hypothetical protein
VLVEGHGVRNITSDWNEHLHGEVFRKKERKKPTGEACDICGFTAVKINAVAFWAMQPCRLVADDQHFHP